MIRFLAAALAGALATVALQAHGAITVREFGVTRGQQRVEQVTLVNQRGMRVELIDFGATITAIHVPDRHARMANVMLGLPTLHDYEVTKRRPGP